GSTTASRSRDWPSWRTSGSSGRRSTRRFGPCGSPRPSRPGWRPPSTHCEGETMTMPDAAGTDPLEEQMAQWRSYLRRGQGIHAVDVEELEDHLRGEIGTVGSAGLSADEAFLVAVKRMGAQDAIANEFAREHSERLWKQLIVAPDMAEG